MTTQHSNWSGHVPLQAARFHEPRTLAEVQAIVRRAERVRVIGAGHSFNDQADTTGDLLSLAKLDNTVTIDRHNHTATVNAGIRYLELGPQLHQAGYALPNLASLSHITVIGAAITATHGSGNAIGSLATAISGLEMVTANGDVVTLTHQRDGDRFNGAVVALGALGVVTKVTLDLQPTYFIQQEAYKNLPLDQFIAHFDTVTGAAYSVNSFTDWQHGQMETIWVKHKLANSQPITVPDQLLGAPLAPHDRPLDPMSDRYLTVMGTPGPWYDRLPHFYFKDALKVGNELQSEYFVPRHHIQAALQAMAELREPIGPLLQITEVRTVAADQLWLSPAYEQPIVGIHFNWHKQWPAIKAFLPTLEAALAPFAPRPHWGKLFLMTPQQVQAHYPRLADFRALCHEFDPQGKFRNRFLDALLG